MSRRGETQGAGVTDVDEIVEAVAHATETLGMPVAGPLARELATKYHKMVRVDNVTTLFRWLQVELTAK